MLTLAERETEMAFRDYIASALWAELDDDGSPFDDAYGFDDIESETRNRLRAEFVRFLEQASECIDFERFRLSRIAHDFWLTRNGHGAGFWDGDYPDDVGDTLTELAESFGSIDLYSDGGNVYALGGIDA